jgi:hypothetical protein
MISKPWTVLAQHLHQAMNKCICFVAIACALQPIWAGAQSDNSGKKSNSIDPDTAQLTTAGEPKPLGTAITGVGNTIPVEAGSTIRCWQEGRLIFEKRFSSGQELVSGTPTLHIRDTASGQDVQAFNMKNALCIVK